MRIMNKSLLFQVFVLSILACACNPSPAEREVFITSPTVSVSFTNTPAIKDKLTSAPTASITPAAITRLEVHDLALNEDNIEKVVNLETFGSTNKTCLNSSTLDSTLEFRLVNRQAQYLLASKDHTSNQFHVWDLESKKIIQTFSAVGVDTISFHPDQNSLVSSFRDEKLTLTLWNIESGGEQHHFALVGGYSTERIPISSDGLRIAVFAGRGDGTGFRVSELNLQTNQVNDTYYDFPFYHEPPPYTYSPKGSLIAVSYGKDDKLHFIDLTNEKDLILEFPFDNLEEVFNVEAIISTIAISPDETYLVGGGLNGVIYIWNLADGTLMKSLEGHEPDRVDGWVGGIKILEFSPQSNLLLSVGYDDFTKLWDASTGALLKELNTCHHFGSFTQDGRYLVAVGKSGIEIWGIP